MQKIEIGKALAAHGIRGEIKILNWSDDPDRLSASREIYVGDDLYEIERSGHPGRTVIVKLKGVDDRNAAEKLCGMICRISERDLRPLPEGTYYVRDLIGLEVIDHESGKRIGTVKDVIKNGPQDVYELDVDGVSVLVPAVGEFIRKVDTEKGCVTIRFIRGMIER